MKSRIYILLILALCPILRANAFSFSLDSIAAMGKVPKFGIDVYRWGDQFFNGYDTTYVVGAGYKFNAKLKADSWIDHYRFYLPEGVRMYMTSEPSTSVGLWLTYLAVSAGYDKNISHFFGSSNTRRREQFYFGFNCSLFAFNMRFNDNTGGVNITKFRAPDMLFNPDIEFYGLHSKYFGADLCYFFNHKQYSQAAAFSFSRLQRISAGSWFAGLSYTNQEFLFDFNGLPTYIIDALPENWANHRYEANTKNVAVKFGYGYNWVPLPNLIVAISESPTVGLKKGTINNPDKESTSVTFNNELRGSVVWNHKEWFVGLVGIVDAAIIYDNGSAIQNSLISGSISVGYRFNLW